MRLRVRVRVRVFFLVIACCCCYRCGLWWRRERREETNRTMSQLIPSAVSLKITGSIGGIGNVLFSTYSQTENGEDPLVSFGEPLNHVITIRGQILVSRTNDDPCLPPCVCTKRSPCVDSKRPRVYRHHAHMCFNICAWCQHTRGRFECTHGGRFVHTRTVFFTFFKRAATHTNTHTSPHGDNDRERQRETETERERKRERERETRQEKRRRDKKREETRRRKRRDEKRQEKMEEERRDM